MLRWEVEYFPPEGLSGSPVDYLHDLSDDDQDEAIRIVRRIDEASRIQQWTEWPRGWKRHQVQDVVWQINAGSQHRLMYCLDGEKMVILHICRKVSQKTRPKDRNTAIRNCADYFASK